ELTFRAAGEGTGAACDLDRFDNEYLHLFLWNSANSEIAGAYRLAGTDKVKRLYTSTLFEYDTGLLRSISPALELGRSFIRPEYQRSFHPLLLLWKGIGRYVADNPRYRILFGPVSISNDYHPVSRELMVTWLERYASMPGWKDLVKAKNPFRRRISSAAVSLASDLDDLVAAVQEVEPSQRGVPVLLRQYLKLGGKLLAFNIDNKFSDALDGLILVDLTKTERKLLDRYLGRAEASTFLEYQKGTYAA